MKHTLCDLQEKIFHLQIQLLEEDIAGGNTEPLYVPFFYLVCTQHSRESAAERKGKANQKLKWLHADAGWSAVGGQSWKRPVIVFAR